MKLALIGGGKMGTAIEEMALKKGHQIALKIDLENSGTFSSKDLHGIDVAFEFTTPEAAYNNVMMCFEADVPVVCGTTGWYDKLVLAEEYCVKNNRSFFYAPNYSIGVNIFFEVNLRLAELMNSQPQYDEVLIHESHHAGKLDSPSGTAISLAKQVMSQVQRLKRWVNYKTDENVNLGVDSDDELPIFSSRDEDVPGTHIVKYFSNVDEIEIVHKALNREGFALGAISAAEWLKGKKGVYGMKDLLEL